MRKLESSDWRWIFQKWVFWYEKQKILNAETKLGKPCWADNHDSSIFLCSARWEKNAAAVLDVRLVGVFWDVISVLLYGIEEKMSPINSLEALQK